MKQEWTKQEVMAQIIDEIKAYQHIAIYRHVYPDPDAYGAQVGMKEIIKTTFKEKNVYMFGKEGEGLDYIGKMDNSAEHEIDESWLAIILDVGDAPRVDDQSFKKCGKVIKIDHHRPFVAPFEDVSWVDISYPATCMMLVDWLHHSKDTLKISKKGREALYVGVVADTGRFEYLDNPTEVFEKITSITYDLEVKPLYEQLYKRKVNKVKFMGYIYSHFEILENGVAVLKIPAEILAQYQLDAMEAARMVNALKDIEGVVNWHFFAELPESKRIACEFRSKGPCVNEIAAKYGGGGHLLAAGATVDNWETVGCIIQDFITNCAE